MGSCCRSYKGWEAVVVIKNEKLLLLLITFYIALFSALKHWSRLTTLLLHVVLNEWLASSFFGAFWISIKVVYIQCCLVVTWLVPRETAAVSARSGYTVQPCTIIMSCYFLQSHICRVHACLAGTCHLHFWQNDWDLLCATAVMLIGKWLRMYLWWNLRTMYLHACQWELP